jgi:hypothetical protein
MFCDMAVILACTLYRMMKFNRRVCAAFCGFSLVGLLGIALTNPLSGFHLVIFLHTLLLSLVWMWWVHREFPEGSLFWSALLGTVGGLICFVSIGVGERMFMLGTLAAINALVYEYLSPQLTRGHS